jgi:hypothetical protein
MLMHYEGLGRPLLQRLKPKGPEVYQCDVAPHPIRYGARVFREKKWILPF